ncbi:uncharacterized protein EV154DRAFT_489422 [Mucor mucedo]|uniref:uncharacterized protein n=1 Tax=Mucor mucedo TaxID=29922 RepID=UPI00221FF893|nr:uncharacterized protein EV154DRAFT_489422 [Mucor mucedo]KAI7897241.1 hypothetical protein EV154DRAFT_489422 [Mucor mucedo]
MPVFYYWFIGPVILWSLLTVGIVFCIIKSSVYRSNISYAALTITLFGLVYAIMNIVSSDHYYYTVPVAIGFDSLRVSFESLPGLMAYLRMSKQIGYKTGRFLVYFGFLYMIPVVAMGVIVTFFAVEEYRSPEIFGFVLRVHCGFITIFLLLLALYWKKLHGKVRITLLLYTLAYVISEIFYLVTTYKARRYFPADIVSIFLVEFPVVLSLMISVLYGHLWTMKRPMQDEKVEINEENKS